MIFNWSAPCSFLQIMMSGTEEMLTYYSRYFSWLQAGDSWIEIQLSYAYSLKLGKEQF